MKLIKMFLTVLMTAFICAYPPSLFGEENFSDLIEIGPHDETENPHPINKFVSYLKGMKLVDGNGAVKEGEPLFFAVISQGKSINNCLSKVLDFNNRGKLFKFHFEDRINSREHKTNTRIDLVRLERGEVYYFLEALAPWVIWNSDSRGNIPYCRLDNSEKERILFIESGSIPEIKIEITFKGENTAREFIFEDVPLNDKSFFEIRGKKIDFKIVKKDRKNAQAYYNFFASMILNRRLAQNLLEPQISWAPNFIDSFKSARITFKIWEDYELLEGIALPYRATTTQGGQIISEGTHLRPLGYKKLSY